VLLLNAPDKVARQQLLTVSKTLGTLLLLLALLPVNLAVTLAALIRSQFVSTLRMVAAQPKTVLISGGKMTKALQLARSFHAAGHRVIMVETGKYRLTGHRFSKSVDRFYTVPMPQDQSYAAALLAIVLAEGVDIYLPVCSPAASWYDALTKSVLGPYCEVFSCDPEMVRTLDDKFQFGVLATSLGLSVPDAHRVTGPEQVTSFDFSDKTGPYILKSIPYNPVHRLDLTTLPRPTLDQTLEFARAKQMSEVNPWIMQTMVKGQEYCTHSTVREGQIQAFSCCESSAFQINYKMVDKPEILDWVRRFVEPLKLTGQVSFDFIQSEDGTVYAIECNPRTHSAITMFYNHPGVASAYLDEDIPMIVPLPSSRPTYWIYHELWRLITQPKELISRLRVIFAGKDAIFDWADPLPFFMVHHVHIPWLLLDSLVHRRYWLKIDFNIGKLIEPAGD